MLNTPPVTKNLILINIVMLLAVYAFIKAFGIDLRSVLGMHYVESSLFHPYQIFTYMFMHFDFWHLFFNMFALYMFGKVLEQVWGGKRFLIYYIVTGVGAVIVHTLVNYFEYSQIEASIAAFNNSPSPEAFASLVHKNFSGAEFQQFYSKLLFAGNNSFHDGSFAAQANLCLKEMLDYSMSTPMVGASGAVFGILLAFGMLFPNTELLLLFPPIPIKAKYFVIIYGAVELFAGVYNPGSNIAHFAHLGGMLFGFILIKYWQRNSKNFY
jgi:membrane associated rhomboid family serine protease